MMEPAITPGFSRRNLFFLAAGAILAALFLLRILAFNHIVEDAYISFRYAKNFAQGQGLVFNPGERVEGYSNFSWTVALALTSRLGLSIPKASQALGFISALLTLMVCVRFLRRVLGAPGTLPWAADLAPALVLVLWPPFSVWTLSGMETVFFSLWVTLAFYHYAFRDDEADSSETGRCAWNWGPVCLLLAALTRPEGAFFGAGILLFHWGTRLRRFRKIGAAVDSRDVWGFLLPAFAYLAWRLSYYGYLLPNSFYAKYGLGSGHVQEGWLYLRQFLIGSLGLAIVLPLGALPWCKPLRRHIWIAALSGIFIGLVTYMGGDIYPFSRYFLPVVPTMAVLGSAVLILLARRGSFMRIILIAAAGAALVWMIRPPGWSVEKNNYAYLRNNDESRLEFVQFMAPDFKPDERIAIQDAGIIPFYLGVPTIDMLGLNDEHIAHRTIPDFEKGIFGHEKHDTEYVVGRNPSRIFFAIHSWNVHDVPLPWIPDRGPLTFTQTYPFVKLRLDQLPAQSLLWQDPLFKIRYIPVVHGYGKSKAILYELDPGIVPILEKSAGHALSDEEARTLSRAFLKKEVFAEGEMFLRRLALRRMIGPGLLEEYRKALRDVPPKVMADYTAARNEIILTHTQAIERTLNEGKVGEAWSRIRLASRLYPDSAPVREARAAWYLQEGRPLLAARLFGEVARDQGERPDLLTNMGVALIRAGDPPGAEACWNRALALDPNFTPARMNLDRLKAAQP